MEQNIVNKQIHLVILGQDASILDESSESAYRTGIYAESFAGISVYIFAKKIPKKVSAYKNVFVFGFSTVAQSLLAFIQIYKDIQLLKKKGVDVLVSTQDAFEIGLIGLIISRISGLLLHVQVHTDIGSKYMQHENIRAYIQYCLSRFVLKRADKIRVVSRRIEIFCEQKLGVKKENIDFVPMLYKRGVRKTSYMPSQIPQIIVMPARFVWFKRIPIALEAFSIALQQNKNIRLRIIGAGPLKIQIEGLIRKYDISKYVEIISWMNAEELYQDASLTLISSIYEGWCRVATESIEAGVPVVMTDVGCAHDFVIDSKHGIIVPIENPQAIANAIVQLLGNTDEYSEARDFCLETSDTIDSFTHYQSKVVLSWISTVSQTK